MIGTTNVGGGNIIAFIIVRYPAGSTCICTKGTKTLRAKGTSGEMVFKIPEAGTWTVSITDGTQTASKDVIVTNYSVYKVSVGYDTAETLKTYTNGIAAPVLLSNNSGDILSNDNLSVTRTSSTPSLLMIAVNFNTAYRQGAFLSATNEIPSSRSGSAPIDDPVAINTQSGHVLYVMRPLCSITSTSATVMKNNTTRKGFGYMESGQIKAYFSTDIGEVVAVDSSAEALEQAAQLNDVITRYALLMDAEVVET